MCLTRSSSNQLNIIFDAIDSDYVKLGHDVRDGTLYSAYASQLKSVMSQLSVDAARIILPKGAVKIILLLVHTSHICMSEIMNCAGLYIFGMACSKTLGK